MKNYILLLMMLPALVQGQTTEPDSLKVKELGELTVVADAQRTGATKTVYIPTGKQKTTASDGISLLAGMNIPQLSVLYQSHGYSADRLCHRHAGIHEGERSGTYRCH